MNLFIRIFFRTKLFFLWVLLFFNACLPAQPSQRKIQNGLDILLSSQQSLVRNKKIALVVNQTSVTSQGVHALEKLKELAEIVYVYAPEHGLEGNIAAGKKIKSQERKSFYLKSLYREKFSAPSLAELKKVDVIIYDIQDTADRFYTYISTLYKTLEMAAQSKTPILILDRPQLNPTNQISGPLLSLGWSSFVGILPLPMHYAMTVGELALLMNQEKILGSSINAPLKVIAMKGYKRSLSFSQVVSRWINPSPNIKNSHTAKMYSGMVLFEGTNISEGRGSSSPFLKVGAPFIDKRKWRKLILQQNPKQENKFTIDPTKFIPKPDFRDWQPKHLGKTCFGLFVLPTKEASTQDVLELTLTMLWAAAKLYPDSFRTTKFLDNLWGSETLRMALEKTKKKNISYKKFRDLIAYNNSAFEKTRKKYLLYR